MLADRDVPAATVAASEMARGVVVGPLLLLLLLLLSAELLLSRRLPSRVAAVPVGLPFLERASLQFR